VRDLSSPGVGLDEKLAFDFDRHNQILTKGTYGAHPYVIRMEDRNIDAPYDEEGVVVVP
jgi:hypothetical protein